MRTRREAVRATIAHQEIDEVPYFINFTGDAGELIQPHFPGPDLSEAIGNYVHWIRPPWWDWHDIPDAYRDFRDPAALPRSRGRGSYEAFEEELKRLRSETDCYILVMIYGSHFEKANAARGIEFFLGDLGGHKPFAKRMLDKIIEKKASLSFGRFMPSSIPFRINSISVISFAPEQTTRGSQLLMLSGLKKSTFPPWGEVGWNQYSRSRPRAVDRYVLTWELRGKGSGSGPENISMIDWSLDN